MRGFHITVRDKNMNIINDEYGPDSGPFDDSRTTPGKILWYRPQDNMLPEYRLGEELEEDFVMKRPPLFKIDNYPNKRDIYFQRIKKSIYLPRCLRDTITTGILL